MECKPIPDALRLFFDARSVREIGKLLLAIEKELPGHWRDDAGFYCGLSCLWLTGFQVRMHRLPLRGLPLMRHVRQTAARFYEENLTGDDAVSLPDERLRPSNLFNWAFVRFRLEIALLRSLDLPDEDLLFCYVYYDVTAGFAAYCTHFQN